MLSLDASTSPSVFLDDTSFPLHDLILACKASSFAWEAVMSFEEDPVLCEWMRLGRNLGQETGLRPPFNPKS